jgi:hypothetical protein
MNATIAVVIAIFALVVVAAFLVFRQKAQVRIKGPLGTGLEVDASNQPAPPPPGVSVEDAKSRKGSLVADDQTGRGAHVRQVEVEDDILVSSTPPAEPPSPKDQPPA